MVEIILATFSGLIIGGIFTLMKLPIPAPPVISGCMAIFGVWAGHHIILQALDYLSR
ncbi:XapX domain-containing protein [Vibrio aestuarianus]|uniref:DUF1427 family protein n=1 Tax=Vibrio aestuarianus TaxID=28171 RepID=A0ABD7YM04_9VIBR|nr:DUF1427 family protein [Vibrio aestuarianus]WGK86102.1 DUF1427 family protein [Vibrio aestuarianus]CAH8194129.1 conserved hypothetical protein [Vibrio aestuarianus]